MNKQDAERVISEYLKPIFGFALKRCKSINDAEDLSQEIILKAYCALTARDDIERTDKFIWTVAHNMLSNYYRSYARQDVGIPVHEMEEILAAPDSEENRYDREQIEKLQKEIAYLSKLQRRIVIAYYFENKKQSEIAAELCIPLGTVKWHLFEAKKELKRGMDTMRQASELKFNPIKFDSYGIIGSPGTKNLDDFFRSTLSQNICYCVRNEAKTVNEIAEDLGVSPVYAETEVEFLEEYGYLKEQKGRYIVNFIISEPTSELLIMQNDMYKRAAELFANDLYDELINSGILDDNRILCNHMLFGSTREKPLRDKNFLLWSLIPYIAACSGERLMEESISFDEVATIRPDGGHNIAHATVSPRNLHLSNDYVCMKNWCGPMWNGNEEHILWQIDSEWSDRDANHRFRYSEDAKRILSLYAYENDNWLSKEDYAWLSECGYIEFNGDYNGNFTTFWKIIVLQDNEIKKELLAIGERIKEKYQTEFDALKAPYAEAVLESVPAHLRKVKAYELQFVFHADGWFLLHCIKTLLKNGKLKEPTENQRKSVSTIIMPK